MKKRVLVEERSSALKYYHKNKEKYKKRKCKKCEKPCHGSMCRKCFGDKKWGKLSFRNRWKKKKLTLNKSNKKND